MTPGISNFVFKTPLSGEISIARLQVNTVNRLGWELTAVFNEQKNGEIQAFGIFRRSTDAALQATLANLEEKQKALAAQETAFAEDRKTFDAVVEAGKQMEAKILALEKAKAEILVQEQDAKARQYTQLNDRIKAAEAACSEARKQLELERNNFQTWKTNYQDLKEKYSQTGSELEKLKTNTKEYEARVLKYTQETCVKINAKQQQIKILEKELERHKKPVMKKGVKAKKASSKQTKRSRKKK